VNPYDRLVANTLQPRQAFLAAVARQNCIHIPIAMFPRIAFILGGLNDGSCVRRRPERPNHVWSYDVMAGRREYDTIRPHGALGYRPSAPVTIAP